MSDASGKISLVLTATQVDLLGEALIEHIPQVAERVSNAAETRTTREETSLLDAYLELARIIIDPHDLTVTGESGSRALNHLHRNDVHCSNVV
ncbi:MAG TPA: hypothetical protein VGD78_05670 [Chthoniobacterales bacterium]